MCEAKALLDSRATAPLPSTLPPILVQEFRNEKHVMRAGKYRKGEDGGVNGGKVIAGSIRDASRQHDDADCDYLDRGVDFTQH